MSEIVKSEYNALGEDNNYKTHFFKTSADQVVGLGRMKNTEYQIGDIVYPDTNNKVAMRCISNGTTSNEELDVSNALFGMDIYDGTCVWNIVGRISDSVPIGTIFAFGANEHPIGYLACDGTAVSRIVYADLFAVIGTTYGGGDGSTTFNLPNLNNNSFLEGSDTAGTVKSAGLPNITGIWWGTRSAANNNDIGMLDSQGACYFNSYGKMSDAGTLNTAYTSNDLRIDASRSSAIYGNSDTVQPKSVTVKFCIKAYGSITNAGSVELENAMKAFEALQAELDKEAGFVKSYAGDVVPEGYLACNGAEISRSTYARLFSHIGTTYGAGDGSTTFNLPNLNNNSFLEGSNTAGTVKSAGLPNVTGSAKGFLGGNNGSQGALWTSKDDGALGAYSVSGSTYKKDNLFIDASKASAVYGNSNTVQPKSVTVKFCIKY